MKKNSLYITMGVLLVSAVLASGAMADDAAPLIKPLISEESVVSASYAADATEDVEAISISDAGYGSLQIKPSYTYLQLQPGETDTFTVTVINRGDTEVTIDPVMVIQPYTENYLEEEWITVTPSDIVLQPDEEKEFTVEVAIPEDADLGYYNANIVFDRSVLGDEAEDLGADSKISSVYYGNSLDLSVEVWTPPVIQVSSNYINDKLEAGREYDYEIKLVNTGDEDIPISPELLVNDVSPEILYASYYGSTGSSAEGGLSDDFISLDAPSEVKAGETATVKIHLEVPENMQGSYSATIDLGIDDPTLDDWAGQVQLYFDVWKQPSEPFVTEFTTVSNGSVRIELSTNQYDYSDSFAVNSKDQPEFSPVLRKDGEEVELHLVKTESKGSVNFGNNDMVLYSATSPSYQQYSTTYTEVYEASGGVGDWELSVLSANTDGFDYSISVGDSD